MTLSYIDYVRPCSPHDIEFIKIAQAVGMGFLLMGFIGYFIKLIHIPINNIIVYATLTLNYRTD